MTLAEVTGRKPRPPRTPQQMRASTEKREEANARVEDVRKSNAIKLAIAQRKAAKT